MDLNNTDNFSQQGEKSGPRSHGMLPAKSAEFLKFCQAHGFIGFSFRQVITVAERGKAKKRPVGMPKWRECVTAESWMKFLVDRGDKAFAIRTGQISGITVIDCDSIDGYRRLMKDFPVLEGSLRIRTAHGFHIYCRYVPGVVSNSNSFHSYPNVDIRNDAAIVFAPPTTYTDCISKERHSYVVDSPTISEEDGCHSIVDFPRALLADLKNYRQNSISAITDTVESKAISKKKGFGTLERLERPKKNYSTRAKYEKFFQAFQAFQAFQPMISSMKNRYLLRTTWREWRRLRKLRNCLGYCRWKSILVIMIDGFVSELSFTMSWVIQNVPVPYSCVSPIFPTSMPVLCGPTLSPLGRVMAVHP
jgi:hypothetical protein